MMIFGHSHHHHDHDVDLAGVREEPVRGRAGEEGTRQEPQPF